MRLISLEIENFLKFERLAMEFADGLTGIIGPNGVGKSSLVEAIAWALYGSPASRAHNEAIPFRRQVPCRVVLNMEVEQDEYRVVRELRGSNLTAHAELFVNGVPTELGPDRVTRILTSRLRMDYRAFLVSFFARQKELDALIAWEPRERKQYILRLLGLARLDRAVADLRRDAEVLKRDLGRMEETLPDREALDNAVRFAQERVADLNKQVSDARTQAEAAEKALKAARARMDELEAQHKEHVRLIGERNLKDQALQNARKQAEQQQQRVKELEGKSAELEKLRPQLNPLAGLRKQREALNLARRLQEQRNAARKNIQGFEQAAAKHREKIEALEKRTAVKEGVQLEREQAEARVAQARSDLTNVRASIQASETRLAQIKKEGQQLTQDLKSVKELGGKAKCPTCRRPLDGSYTDVVAHLEKELAALREEHREYTRFLKEDTRRAESLEQAIRDGELEVRRLEQKLRDIARAEAELVAEREAASRTNKLIEDERKRLGDLGEDDYDAAEHRRVDDEVQRIEGIERRVTTLEGEVTGLPRERQILAEAEAEVPKREAELRQAEAALRELGFDADSYQRQRSQCDELEKKHRAAVDEWHRLEREEARAQSELQHAQKARRDYEDKQDEIALRRVQKENLDELRALMEAFRVNLVGRIRPALAARASGLVRDVTDGKYSHIELDEAYNAWMFDDGERRELRSFSGGENDLVHLCLRLAISELIGDAAGGAEHGFLILDEVLGSQDSERRALILQALGRLSRRFRQILLITHVDDIKEMVEHVAELRETPNGSSELIPV